ncbi:hypothetical protein GV51_0512 [Gardnerella vaginalis 5-1]|jgi:hypothetical protein|nr:hypothetical protein GV51_0512 [Gardnerella vaginalis 5-1]
MIKLITEAHTNLFIINKCKEIIEREKQYSKKFSTVSEELKKKFLVNI